MIISSTLDFSDHKFCAVACLKLTLVGSQSSQDSFLVKSLQLLFEFCVNSICFLGVYGFTVSAFQLFKLSESSLLPWHSACECLTILEVKGHRSLLRTVSDTRGGPQNKPSTSVYISANYGPIYTFLSLAHSAETLQ